MRRVSLPSSRYERVKRIFDRAIELPTGEREAFVRRECGDDLALRDEVSRLLASPGLSTDDVQAALGRHGLDTSSAGGATTPKVGSVVGHYHILSQIGKGGMGTVFHAKDTSLDRDVAIKFLPADWGLGTERLRLFRDEAKTLASLNHPNIVVIHAIQDVEGVPSMVMELLEGQTLRELVLDDGIPIRQALNYAVPIADALSAAHTSGITHRDLKPENIMVTQDGRVKVLDFGIAKRQSHGILDEQTVATTDAHIVGTPRYMSPEQLQGQAIDPRSDIFSFGIVLHELVVGRHPFSGASIGDIARSIINDDLAPLPITPDLPETLAAIVRRCLQKRPEDRPRTMAAVHDELVSLRSEVEQKALTELVSGTRSAAEPWDAPSNPRRAAVLPFQDLSLDADQSFFCVGISEEIATELSRVRNVRVSVASRVERASIDPNEMAKLLGAEVVVDGSVRRSGDEMRITVRVCKVPDGSILWLSRFDRPIVDTFAIQDEVAQAVARAFNEEIAPQRSRATSSNADAYGAFLRGRYFFGRLHEHGLQRALESFGEALELEPHMPKAHIGSANCFIILGHHGYMKPQEAYGLARQSVERALALEPDLAEAHAALGWIQAFFDWNWDEAEASLRHACDLNPNYAAAWEGLGVLLLARDRHDAALEAIRAARGLDPLSLTNGTIQALVCFESGDVAEGDRVIGAVKRMDPRFPLALNVHGGMLAALGRASEAVEILERSISVGGGEGLTLSHLGYAYGRQGRIEEARKVVDELQATASRQYVAPLHIAIPLVGAGLHDEAMKWLERAVAERDSFFAATSNSCVYRPITNDSRFRVLIESIAP